MYRKRSKREIQEILTTIERTDIIKSFINEAILNFQKNTSGLPEQIVIYRDGMGGQTMTGKVKGIEMKLIINMLETTVQTYKPKIIFCLVDRNSHLRLFDKQNQQIFNPCPGTVVDTGLVEQQGDKIFDFYLISNYVTQGTAKPVLYSVVYNTSSLNKNDF